LLISLSFCIFSLFAFFSTATSLSYIYTLSLHDALPICYYFVHSSRYLAFAFAKYSGAEFSVHVMKNASDNIEDRLYYEKFSKDYSGTTILYTDLGKPDFKEKNVTFKIGWTLNWGPRDEMIRFIIRNVY